MFPLNIYLSRGPPPLYFLFLWFKSITFDTLLESPLASTLIICKKKLQICKIFNTFCNLQNQVFRQKMCKTKKCAKYYKLYIFEKPLTRRIVCKIWIQGKLKMCKFSVKAFVQKSMTNFFANIVQSAFSFVQDFSKSFTMLKLNDQ